jgi:hypothetical protein
VKLIPVDGFWFIEKKRTTSTSQHPFSPSRTIPGIFASEAYENLIYTQRREPCLTDRVYCLFQQPGSPKWPQQFCNFTILIELFLTKRSNFFLKGMGTFRLLRTAFTLGCSGLHILIFPLYHINRHFKFRKSKK